MCLRCQMTFGRRHIGRERGFPIPGPARSCPEEKLPSGEQMPGGREWDARGHAGERGKAPSFQTYGPEDLAEVSTGSRAYA